MNGNEPVGFWSYTHRDNQLDSGRIQRLSEYIANAFEIISGEPLEIFFDNDSIEWGDAWRLRLDSALTGVTFLIPIVTPKFIKSQECRREVITFSGHAASLGLDELLLPIHYVNVPQLTDEPTDQPADEVVSLIARRQWVDWRDLRLEDEESPRYRQAVHKLALRLSEILDSAPPPTPRDPTPPAPGDDEPGFIEVMAATEAALPQWLETVQQFTELIQFVGEATAWAAGEMSASDSRGGGFSGRMRVTQELSSRFTGPVQKADTLGSKYWIELSAVDAGVIGIIRAASEGGLSLDDQNSVDEFFVNIKELAAATKTTSVKLEELSDGMEEAAKKSRQLRPQFRTIQAAVQKVIDGQTIIDEWQRMIDELGGGDPT
ncbi:toll/interleukin-1 receptor domain-containing protein [Streptomyces sp. NPDC048357]|uniref:toll/interleukin-1 receptor domain-containing protein n=1 Tax=Streptomyces sp. NPDC048357 TaxID=3154719 RepID=UPI00341711AE